jgi:hypothetical protein
MIAIFFKRYLNAVTMSLSLHIILFLGHKSVTNWRKGREKQKREIDKGERKRERKEEEREI